VTDQREFPREYLADDFDAADIEQIAAGYRELAGREVPDVSSLERWCVDWSELQAAVYEEIVRLRIASTRNTEDTEIKDRYTDWMSNVYPKVKEREFALWKKLAGHPSAEELPSDEFAVFLRSVRNAVEMYREENTPLEKEAEFLAREYDEVRGAMTVEFDGEERTFPQLHKYMEEQDREKREGAWIGMRERCAEDEGRLTRVFEKLLDLRGRMASNADFDDYRAYRFQQLQRFDYTPEDCIEFHRSIEEVAVPIVTRLFEGQAEKLGLERLRPWDTEVDPDGLDPLRPFRTTEEFVEGVRKCFVEVDPSFGEHFAMMARRDLLDLESRKAKAPGGYNSNLMEQRLPFIFMNAVGTHGDLNVLFHEGGHAFHLLEHRNQRLLSNRTSPMEFAEVASMSMELLASRHMTGVFYDEAETRRARIAHMRRVFNLFPAAATIDAFQHWLYTHPGHAAEERTAEWLRLHRRFHPQLDWEGLERYRELSWQFVGHLYFSAFYYVEYAIAQLGAIQVWRNYLRDPKETVAALRRAFSLGFSRTLPELFETAGIRFDFSIETVRELLGFAEEEYRKLLDS
jgi:oligoendopeptidase F